MAYFDYDVTVDDLCVLGKRGCIKQVAFIDKGMSQVWLFEDTENNELIVSFRGSDSMWDVLTNFCILPEPFMVRGEGGLVHKGHLKCYKTVRNDILGHVMEFVKKNGERVSVCGHSLGGACATICALELALLTNLHVTCYSYGAMAFADRQFNQSTQRTVKDSWRVVHEGDFAPGIPMFFYKHHNDALYLKHHVQRSNTFRSPVHRMYSYIRYHSIESYIGGLRRLQRSHIQKSGPGYKF